MTISIIGIWELGRNTPLVEHGLWLHPLKDFGVNHWLMTPVSGLVGEMVLEYAELSREITNARTQIGAEVVFVDERGDGGL
jgi:hypothetical protein